MIQNYLNQLDKTASMGDAREESYYPALSELIKTFSPEAGFKNIQITTLPKKTDAGNPDFRIWDGTENIVGYIEAKRPGENLDLIENSPQLKRYRKTFPNLILTDFYEFRLYRQGELTGSTFIARSSLAKKGIPPPAENIEKLNSLFLKFLSFSLPVVRTAEELARELAKRTRFLRDEVISIELDQQQSGNGELINFYETFRTFLIADLKIDDFADLFSQTITYGLFAARTRSSNGFNRKLAFDLIPKTIGILRNVFKFISLGDLPRNLEVMVDDIAGVLNVADTKNILHQYYKAGKGDDPIVHFYETFLAEYDPSTREKRGVYYTPEPVVRYMVRSVHEILKTHFGMEHGLADQGVTLLDPAGGTLTFPTEAIKLTIRDFEDKYGEGVRGQLIRDHILNHFYAFELMMAPYAIGHIKVSLLLEELGYTLGENERFKLYLTNTLDMEDLQQTRIPGLESLSNESHEAGKIKKNEPILVIVGNPPYSGHSANRNAWTEKLLKEDIDGAQSYYKVDGQALGEKNPKWLQDDYVKFLRFAQWKIHKAGRGVVAMITNHSYLDNPTFRGMRQSLMNTFNEMYFLDLHGNSLKKETTPDGGKDVNVFDIQQGVAIAIMVKQANQTGSRVYVGDLYGSREQKYHWLDHTAFDKLNYEPEKPISPFYFLKKTNTGHLKHYLQWPNMQDIFPVNSVGIVTARDNLTIKWTATEILNTVKNFARMDPELARITYKLGNDARDWQVKLAQDDLKKAGPIPENVLPILYRPFDTRFTYYTGISRGFHCMPRPDVMTHLLQDNIALAIGRQGQVVGKEFQWNLAFISNEIVDFNLFYRGGELIFPLYIYKPEIEKKKKSSIQSIMLFEPEEDYGEGGKKPNIDPKIFAPLEKAFHTKPSPEQILYYCYAVLYSPGYRVKYAEFLKIDFPRIPFTNDYSIFTKMAALGEELAQLHLLKSKALNKTVVRYRGSDQTLIEKPRFDAERNLVFINEDHYFEGITPEMWNYQIGGYQVLDKYLKDRKGRQMSDPLNYCRIASAIAYTIIIQQNLDEVFNKIEKGF